MGLSQSIRKLRREQGSQSLNAFLAGKSLTNRAKEAETHFQFHLPQYEQEITV